MNRDELYAAAFQLEFSGSPEDLPEIERLYREAAAGGSLDAMARLGLLVEGQIRATMEGRSPNEGLGDLGEAARWYRKAAEGGHAQAAFFLGRLYSDKLGDWARAEPWYRRAAEGGNRAGREHLDQGPHGAAQRRAAEVQLSSVPPETGGSRPRPVTGKPVSGCAVLAVAALLPMLLAVVALPAKTA